MFVQTEAYIGAQCIGNYQKKTKPKAITRIIWEETKIETNRAQRQKAEKQDEQWLGGEQCAQE